MNREKALHLSGGLETLHDALPSSGRLMAVLRAIVQAPVHWLNRTNGLPCFAAITLQGAVLDLFIRYVDPLLIHVHLHTACGQAIERRAGGPSPPARCRQIPGPRGPSRRRTHQQSERDCLRSHSHLGSQEAGSPADGPHPQRNASSRPPPTIISLADQSVSTQAGPNADFLTERDKRLRSFAALRSLMDNSSGCVNRFRAT